MIEVPNLGTISNNLAFNQTTLSRYSYIFFSLLLLASRYSVAQDLPVPVCEVDAYFFTDSTKIQLVKISQQGIPMMEKGEGMSTFFREYNGPFYVDQTKTLRFKTTHPDYEDSKMTVVKVYKLSDYKVEILGDYGHLVDRKKGSPELSSSEWTHVHQERIEFQISCPYKKLEEIELLSHVNTERAILPPKKVTIYAHLKNGEKVHIRTSNTIGSFKNSEQHWSHVLRLSGKPKLKKILKKTTHFSIVVEAQIKKGVPQKMAFDEILAR